MTESALFMLEMQHKIKIVLLVFVEKFRKDMMTKYTDGISTMLLILEVCKPLQYFKNFLQNHIPLLF